MKKQILFLINKQGVSNLDFLGYLRKIKADETDVLYIHTALNFGVPNRQLKKHQLLECLYEVFEELKIPTLIFPTYTFSFCNGFDYDVNSSKSSMGLLNEYVRINTNSLRSVDPLMSNVLIGKHKEYVQNIGKSSVGENSTFDLLHKSNHRVKFLFFGPKIGDCFTYMHYMEERQKVPYRYDRKFTGQINDGVSTYTDTYDLFVRYSNVLPGGGSYIYENMMVEKGICTRIKAGNTYISVIEEKLAYECYNDLLEQSPNFYITEVFNLDEATTEFHAHNMIAL